MAMIEKLISGAQTGADLGGLKAAKTAEIATGGWIPKGFITLDGPRPEYAELYGIQEHTSDKYPPRTFANARDSDGTMRFAAKWDSPGEICTLKAINQYKKPHFDVDLLNPEPRSVHKAAMWIVTNGIKVLNVAGNAEKTHHGTEAKVVGYLGMLFEYLKIVDECTADLSDAINAEIETEIIAELRGEDSTEEVAKTRAASVAKMKKDAAAKLIGLASGDFGR